MVVNLQRTVFYFALLSSFLRSTGFLVSPLARYARTARFAIAETVDRFETTDTAIDDSLVIQKNLILLEKLISPLAGNLTETAYEYVNFCDDSFNQFLNERIASCESKTGKTTLGRIRYELNVARQKKLTEADRILRGILKSGGVQEMEAQLRVHLRRAEIDMAFMVILQLNIEDAMRADARKAMEVMTHLGEIITAHQDALVSAPVRLVRQLVRTEDGAQRKQLLRQHLIVTDSTVGTSTAATNGARGAYGPRTVRQPGSPAQPFAATPRPASAARTAGSVTAMELEDTLKDLLLQMRGIGNTQEPAKLDLQRRCGVLRREINEVLAERSHVPPVSGMQ